MPTGPHAHPLECTFKPCIPAKPASRNCDRLIALSLLIIVKYIVNSFVSFLSSVVAFILAVVIGLFFMFLIFVSFYIVLFIIWLLREAVIALWALSAFRVPVRVPPRARG